MVLAVYYLLLTILFMHHLDDGLFSSYFVSGGQVRKITVGDFIPNGALDQAKEIPQPVIMTREDVAMIVSALESSYAN